MAKSVSVSLPLLEYEKRLLDEYRTKFLGGQSEDPKFTSDTILETFNLWKWRKKTEMAFADVLGMPEYCAVHGGKWSLILECYSRTVGSDRNALRTISVMKANSTHDDLDLGMVEEIFAKPVGTDLQYWHLLTAALETFRSAPPRYEGPFESTKDKKAHQESLYEDIDFENFNIKEYAADELLCEKVRDRNWRFEIWSLLRSCALIKRDQTLEFELRDSLEGISATGFFNIYEGVKNGYVKKGRNLSEDPPERSGQYLNPEVYRLFSFQDDPRKYIEIVPWNQLVECIPKEVLQDVPPSRFVCWKPAQSLSCERLFFTEEDVFANCVDHGITFPGYRMADSICFMISAVETLDFSQGAYDWFWRNDCSLTKNPQSNEWHLLQTIPGYQYRNKKIEQDEQAAKKVFRNWLQRELDRRSGREQKQLKEAMGLQYNPKYENLLDLIPAEEITLVYPDALGEGASGTVYHATWHRPKRVGDLEAETLEVALKRFKGDEESDLGRFIKELDATFAVVQGWGVRVVQLFGILRTPQHHDPGSPLSLLPTGTFFLVTEFCEKGSLLEHLKEVLKGDVTDWKIIISAVAELSTGLRELHKHNVVHKDLHARNVLVARRFYSADPGTGVYEPVILIADLGEGQILSSDISNPENHLEEDGKARDIRALGQLIWRMVQTQWEESDKNPNAESPAKHYLPQTVLLAILQCMREDRDKQPTAEYIMDEFELLDREWDDKGYAESFLNLLEMDSERMEYLFSALREKETPEKVLKKFTTITD